MAETILLVDDDATFRTRLARALRDRGHGTIEAATVLARHDENYMPKEVADALKASGTWVDGQRMPEALAVTAGAGEEPSGAQ